MVPGSAGTVRHVHGSFEASTDAPGRARLLVADALERWGLDTAGLADQVTLLTSELVTNAIRHCRRRVELHAHHENGVLRVEVLDHSPKEPGASPADPLAEKGRGLQIVEAVATRWGVEPTADGKRVWFEVATAG